MNFTIYSIAFVALAAILLATLVHNSRRKRLLLYIFIPLLTLFSLYSYRAINSELGYATSDVALLQNEFVLITYTSGQDQDLFLLVQFKGEVEPRMFKVHDPGGNIEQKIREAQEAQRGKKGQANGGEEGEGDGDGSGEGLLAGKLESSGFGTETQFKFYPFNPTERLKKD
jgi:hypothetical protein